jgi:ABC-2 type transport system permease protein
VKTRVATARRLPDGRHEVTLEVVAQKLRADSLGVETPAPMNDIVDVGVFAAERDDPMYVVRHRIRSGAQTIRVIVPQEPSRAGIDPYRKLIERERGDNVVAVNGAG